MKVEHFTQTPAEDYADLNGVSIRWVIDKKDGAPNFAMRVIDVQAGCNTPFHTHGFEHEVFVLEGQGVVCGPEGEEMPIGPGTIVYVPPDGEHGFYNRSEDELLRFICVIPHVD